jgi:nickel-dependent lactate racemase
MKVLLAFGTQGLELHLPDGSRYEVLRVHAAPPLEKPTFALEQALDRPIGCASLVEMVIGKKTAAISVCDITRTAPNSVTLPPLLERLHRAGMKTDDITIFIAQGCTAPQRTKRSTRFSGLRLLQATRL